MYICIVEYLAKYNLYFGQYRHEENRKVKIINENQMKINVLMFLIFFCRETGRLFAGESLEPSKRIAWK